ncbi:MAG: RNA methyltransferase [Candidatus Omnitrophica bacterium]|nr:RNA methyltransferase [Candidatus Omnitrophota bacterium]
MAKRCPQKLKTCIVIQGADDPRLAPYKSLKGKELERDGIFIAEGEKVVKCMIGSGLRIASCLTAVGTTGRYGSILATMSKRGVPVYIAADKLIEKIIGFRFHKGIMAIGYCPKKITVSEALKDCKRPLLLVALNAVNDPQNVGLIVRNAAAFGAQALIIDNATYDPYYRKAVRVSMGTVFGLPVCYEDDLRSSLIRLKSKYDTRIIAATPGKGAGDLTKARLSGNICFVFGNEDKGVSRKILSVADTKVRIPISKAVDSLNVASASAVCLYEASRYRGTR